MSKKYRWLEVFKIYLTTKRSFFHAKIKLSTFPYGKILLPLISFGRFSNDLSTNTAISTQMYKQLLVIQQYFIS